MKVECKLKSLKRTVSAGKNINTLSMYGEIGEGENRLCSVNVIINNVSDAGIKELEKKMKIEDMEAAVMNGFPIEVEMKTLQKTIGS